MIIFSTGLEDFIDKFIAESKSIEVCPFCALESFYDLQGQSRREIGHWLCKEQYPYLVVNFDNLVPIGHDCTLVKHRCVYYPEYRLHLTFKRTGTNKKKKKRGLGVSDINPMIPKMMI